MTMKKILLACTTLLLVGAGCSSGTPAPTPTPPAGGTPPAATAPTPPAESSTATVTMTGAATAQGTFPARCAAYFPAENKGVVFETDIAGGWHLQIGDSVKRVEGLSTDYDAGILNGPSASYTIVREESRVTFGPQFKSATINAKFKQIYKENYINIVATFDCK